MKYIRGLFGLFEHQPMAITAITSGVRQLTMTDRRLIVTEPMPTRDPLEDAAATYIPVCAFEDFDPMTIGIDPDAAGLPVYPDGTDLVSAEEASTALGNKLMPAKDLLAGIDQLISGMAAFPLPSNLHTLKQAWVSFRFKGGDVLVRTADEYADLDTAMEVAMAKYVAEIDDGTCFAVPTEVFKVCHELSGDKISIGMRSKKGVVYVCVRTPGVTISYGCKPLKLEDPVVEEPEEVVETVENLAAGAPTETQEAPGNAEAQQPTVEVPSEEQGTEAQAETTEPVPPVESNDAAEVSGVGAAEPGADDGAGDGAGEGEVEAPKPKAEDVPPMEALDEVIRDLIKDTKDVVHKNMVELEKVRKNVAKQVRPAMKRQTDPAEVAELKRKLATETKRANTAEAAYTKLKGGLGALKGLL